MVSWILCAGVPEYDSTLRWHPERNWHCLAGSEVSTSDGASLALEDAIEESHPFGFPYSSPSRRATDSRSGRGRDQRTRHCSAGGAKHERSGGCQREAGGAVYL